MFFSHLGRENGLTSLWKTPVALCLGMPWASRELVESVVSGPRGHLGPNSPAAKGNPRGSSVNLYARPCAPWAPPHPYGFAFLFPMLGQYQPPFLQLLLLSFSKTCLRRNVPWKVPLQSDPAPSFTPSQSSHHLYHVAINALSMSILPLSTVSFDLPIPPVLYIIKSRAIFLLFICN